MALCELVIYCAIMKSGGNQSGEGGEGKLRELILYLADKCEHDTYFGATKLNKLLYFCDFWAFSSFGKAITDVEYQRLPQGPAPRRMVPVIEEMEREGSIAVKKQLCYGKEQTRVIALRSADFSVFSAQEIALIDHVFQQFDGLTGANISEISHRSIGWRLAKDGETIPYSTAMIEEGELTADESSYGSRLDGFARERLAVRA